MSRHQRRFGRGTKGVLELLLIVALTSISLVSFASSASASPTPTITCDTPADGLVISCTTATNTTVDIKIVPAGDPATIENTDVPALGGNAIDDPSETGILYTPPADFNTDPGNPDSFGVMLSNSSDEYQVFVTTEALDARVIRPTSNLYENEQVTTNVIAATNDPGGEPLTVSVFQQAEDGQCLAPSPKTEVPAGNIGWIPDKNFIGGDSCLYQVSDAAGNTAVASLDFGVKQNRVPTVVLTPKAATLHKADGSVAALICNPNPTQVVYTLRLVGVSGTSIQAILGPQGCKTEHFTTLRARYYTVRVTSDDASFQYKESTTQVKTIPVFAPTARISRSGPEHASVVFNTTNCSIRGKVTIINDGHKQHLSVPPDDLKFAVKVTLVKGTHPVLVYKGTKLVRKDLLASHSFTRK